MEKKELDLSKIADKAVNGKLEIVFLEGEAPKYLAPVKPLEEKPLKISGDIGTVYEFLKKRGVLFEQNKCNIAVIKSQGAIMFTANECQGENKNITSVSSVLKTTDIFRDIQVNNDREFEALELARFLRKRKGLFADPEQFTKVWLALSSFKAEVTKRIEKADDKSGNMTRFIKQEVTSNMPKFFTLNIPVFENSPKIKIDVEVDVDANTLNCSLVSFDLDEKVEELKSSLIEGELNREIEKDFQVRDYCVTYYS